jgi:hypothetical protein
METHGTGWEGWKSGEKGDEKGEKGNEIISFLHVPRSGRRKVLAIYFYERGRAKTFLSFEASR